MHLVHEDRKLKNEKELEYSIQCIAKMYAIRDVQAVEPLYSPQLREEMIEDTSSMIRKIEGEVAEYLARKYGYIAQVADNTTREAAAEKIPAHKQTPVLQTEQAA